MKKGYFQVYTGNGKGKTTAAFGLAVRATGADQKVFIGQFVKGMKYSEIKAISHLPGITVRQYGQDCFIEHEPTKKDIELAQKGLAEVAKIIQTGQYDMVILDEAHIALYYNLFTVDELIQIMQNKPKHVEIVTTGRYAPDELIAIADLVTEMKEVKHYYQQGIEAREGIEY